MPGTDDSMVSAKGDGPAWPVWLEDLYERADARDAAGFASGFGSAGTLKFGNAPILTGTAEIEASLEGLFASIKSMRHRVLGVWHDGDDLIFEAIVTYGRLDGESLGIPAVTAYTRGEDGALHARIYCDMAPVFSPK